MIRRSSDYCDSERNIARNDAIVAKDPTRLTSRFPLGRSRRGRCLSPLSNYSRSLSLSRLLPGCSLGAVRAREWHDDDYERRAATLAFLRSGGRRRVAPRRAEPSRRRRGITCRKRDALRPTREATRATACARGLPAPFCLCNCRAADFARRAPDIVPLDTPLLLCMCVCPIRLTRVFRDFFSVFFFCTRQRSIALSLCLYLAVPISFLLQRAALLPPSPGGDA